MKSLSNLIVLNEAYSQNQEEIQIDKEEILIDDYFVFNQRSAISRKVLSITAARASIM